MDAAALALVLTLLGAPGASAADAAPAARSELAQQAHGIEVLLAARQRLVAERAALQARADVLAGQVAQAKRNRGVLSDAALKANLAEALGVGKALEAADHKLANLDRMIDDAAAGLDRSVDRLGRTLPDADRRALAAEASRVRARLPAKAGGLPAGRGVEVSAGMDAQALRERADVAGDYEDKLRREATRAEARIAALEAQQGMAVEARRMSGDQHLFDEGEVVIRQAVAVARPAPKSSPEGHAGPTGSSSGGGGAQAPATEGTDRGNDASDFATGALGGGAAPADPGSGGGAATPRATSDAASVGTPRTQTVVDERTFALLRESRTPADGLSAAEELRRLRERRAALLRAAARLRALQEQLQGQAGAPQR